jgi:CRP-like cAMP-binding protein
MKLKPEQEIEALGVLKILPLFTGCPEAALQAMVKLLDFRDVGLGKVVMMDQEIGRTLYILAKGSVGIWKRVGGEKKQLATLAAPNFFGERSMFEESPASALVKSSERSVIYALDRPQFDQLAAQFPAIQEPIKKQMLEIREKRMGPQAPKPEE